MRYISGQKSTNFTLKPNQPMTQMNCEICVVLKYMFTNSTLTFELTTVYVTPTILPIVRMN